MIKEFLKYAVPSALAMFCSSLYTIIDGIFVGQGVGDLALAAVNIVLPFTIMLFGTATMFAVGGGALVSKNLGAGKNEEAISSFRQVFKFLLIISAIISLICVVFTEPIVKLLGAKYDLIGLSAEYLRFYAIFCIPNLVGIALNSFVRNDGRPKLAMIATISGALTNVVLDYIFIFIFNFGIKGAAIATGLGQIVTVSIVMPHFIKKKGTLTLGRARLDKNLIKEFINLGFPSFFTEITFSIMVLLQNIALVKQVGEIGVSAFSIVNYINSNIYMVLLGLTFGAQPLISYNYGAKDEQKTVGFYKITLVASLVVNSVFLMICLIFGKNIISIFTSNTEIIKLAYRGLNIINLGFFMLGLNLTTTVYYQAIERPKLSNIICLFRSIVFLPICVMVLSFVFKLNGIWISILFSEGITFVIVHFTQRLKLGVEKAANYIKN